jgi:hypothetical protein
MGKHFTNIKNMHNHLSPRTIEHKNEIQLLACERHKYVMGLHQLIGSPSPSWQFDLQQQYNHFILDSSHDGMIPFTKSHNVGSLLRFCETIWLKIYDYRVFSLYIIHFIQEAEERVSAILIII